MRKFLPILILVSFLVGCAPTKEVVKVPEPVSLAKRDLRKEPEKISLAKRDLMPPKKKVHLPIIFKAGTFDEAKWAFSSNVSGDFAVGGAYLDGKSYFGGYGSGKLYSEPPLITELDNTGEAILSIVVFKGVVYASSENNNMAGQRTRVFRKINNSWQEVGIEGYAAFFMTVWQNNLIVTSTRNLSTIDINLSADGDSYGRIATLNDWLWVPAVFRNELYILGHSGGPGGPGSAKAVKWTGNGFVDVPALCNTPGVLEWQSAVEHGGYMYVGSGGWTIGRGSSMAAIYRFDGVNAVQVKADGAYHEVQTLLSANGILYATFGHGFKSDEGGSKIWALRGSEWKEFGVFPDSPQLYVLLQTPEGQVAAGGSQGNFRSYVNPTAPKRRLP